MSISTIVSMLGIILFVVGGFSYFLSIAIKKEAEKDQHS